MTEQPSQRLGRYTILNELGRGGHATVYQAFEPELEREVALKVLHPALHSDPDFVQRFRREAKALAALRHPNVVVIYEVGEADGRMYIAMELAHGQSLAHRIAKEGALPWKEILQIMRQVCAALQYAHNQGIIHRDLKPSNILLDQDRGVLLSDFGLARLIGASGTSMSMSQGILGTPAYIAPEIWDLNVATAQADVYAMGCILYEMLTGKMLFSGQTPMQILHAHDKGPVLPAVWPEGIPSGITGVLHQSLARSLEERFQDANQLCQALDGLEAQALQAAEAEKQAQEKAALQRAALDQAALDQAALDQAAARGGQERTAQERAAAAAQWRAAAENALARKDWDAALLAAARWLEVQPGNASALALQQAVEHRRKLAAQEPSQPNIETGEQAALDGQQGQDLSGTKQQRIKKDQPSPPPRPNTVLVMALVGVGILACLGLVLAGSRMLPGLLQNPTAAAQLLTTVSTQPVTALVQATATLVSPTPAATATHTPPPATQAPTATQAHPTATRVVLRPLDFMAFYYDLLAQDKCEDAYAQLTDNYKDTFPEQNRYGQYEDWCINVQHVEFLEQDVLSEDGRTAFVRILLRWTFPNGQIVETRPMQVGLVRDPDTTEWRIDTSVFTQ